MKSVQQDYYNLTNLRMMIEEIPINKIKFDSTQPRRFVDNKKVAGMAKSILTQGLINPIEVDKYHVIVTGELRYRACREAGLKTIQAKVINIGKDRFERQVIENIHHNTMTPWDTAVSLQKLLSSYQGRTKHNDKGISQLAKKLGQSEGWIRQMLGLLDSSKEMQDALKGNKIARTFVREIAVAPKEIRKELEKKVARGQIGSRDTVRHIRKAVNDNPDKAKQIMNLNLKGKTIEEAKKAISKVAETKQERQWKENDYFEQLEDVARKLTTLLNKNPLGKSSKTAMLNEFSKQVVYSVLVPLPAMIASFIKGYDTKAKIASQVIDGEII